MRADLLADLGTAGLILREDYLVSVELVHVTLSRHTIEDHPVIQGAWGWCDHCRDYVASTLEA
jgi:hypothetical protein